MLKRIVLGMVLLAGLLVGTAWADDSLNSELFQAVFSEDKARVEELIAKGAEVNSKQGVYGNTPLHDAATALHGKIVELLIAKGADVNARNDKGLTPLQQINQLDYSRQNCLQRDYTVEKGCIITKQLIVTMLQDAQAKILAKQAEPSRGGIQQLLADSKGMGDNDTLRKAIIDLALKLKPAPAIPPEAEAAAGRAAYIFKNAKSDDDTLSAAKEFLKAIEAAPWVANYYYNLCTVLEKTPYTQQALHACKLYLTAAPNAADAADMQQRIAGLQYAVDKNKEQMKQRADHYNINGMYRMGGLSGQVSGKDMGLKLTVDWQAAPPRYQVMQACTDAGGVYTYVYDLTSTDTWLRISCEPIVNMHLIIKPEGAGFVELGDASTGSIRTTLDELFKLRRKALEESEIFSRADKTYVAALQGGLNKQYAGYAMYESDCTGNPLRQDARALPDDFVTLEMKESGKSPYSSYGSSCASQFLNKTGYSFGENE